ncbi:octopine/nopaline transport system ATP-binding protein [Rhizobium leucaenae]|uniref:Octopine/nopaline transport system ATP-binding protein n=1 Tax=Rhizobium leucaenae TaxID=29450 RepID=A0A7W6ZYL6_9HYPH|nr:octopine/nopaline transport system ATP-binding protein [Rhizobium leucaenae]
MVSDNIQKSAAVSVKDLRKCFGPLEVLKGVSLEAHEGDVISILGSSGSGKSTMLRCINMLEVPDSGEIRIGGEMFSLKKGRHRTEPADRRQVDRLREHIGMVFQSFNLWSHMTILENVIEAPVHVQKRNRAECVAEAEALPNELESPTSEISIQPIYLEVSSNARRLLVLLRSGRRSCCLTSRPLRLIPNLLAKCLKSCARLPKRVEPCWS